MPNECDATLQSTHVAFHRCPWKFHGSVHFYWTIVPLLCRNCMVALHFFSTIAAQHLKSCRPRSFPSR